jgi:hypothetical protein
VAEVFGAELQLDALRGEGEGAAMTPAMFMSAAGGRT